MIYPENDHGPLYRKSVIGPVPLIVKTPEFASKFQVILSPHVPDAGMAFSAQTVPGSNASTIHSASRVESNRFFMEISLQFLMCLTKNGQQFAGAALRSASVHLDVTEL